MQSRQLTMQKSIQLDRPEVSRNRSDGTNHVHNQRIVVPAKLIDTERTDGFEKNEQSWMFTCQIPSDFSIQVEDFTFYVHKYPLISKCGYLRQYELPPPNSHLGYDLKLEKFPGGSQTFEIILKFCYGVPISLDPNNVAAMRCASVFLDMSEAMEDGNLIAKTEAFFTFVALSSWNDTVTVLRSCELLSPWAENLQIVRRCCDSVARKITRGNSTGKILIEENWWFNDVTSLHINHFSRIIKALRATGMNPEIIGSCIIHYGKKWLPGMDTETEGTGKCGGRNDLGWSMMSGRKQEMDIGQNKEHRTIIESLVSALPPQKEDVSCKFLLWMLKMAIVHAASPVLVSELEKRIGMVLENASVNDLLIPTYAAGEENKGSTEKQTMHNTEAVRRILEYFLLYVQQLQQQELESMTFNISKLVDSYLAEIARDPNVSIDRFQVLAESLPRQARASHDGLYRAIDTYLKTRPSLLEHDRRRLCKSMDCEKLSLDAHAAQNDRLPLRIVIQVLFLEQVKMRAAAQGKDHIASDDESDKKSSKSSTTKEVKSLKEELGKVKIQMEELQRDYSELQQEYKKVNKKSRSLTSWTFGCRKMKESALVQGNLDSEVTEEGQNGLKGGCKVSSRRRQSMS